MRRPRAQARPQGQGPGPGRSGAWSFACSSPTARALSGPSPLRLSQGYHPAPPHETFRFRANFWRASERAEAQLAHLPRQAAGPEDAGREVRLVRPIREPLRLEAEAAPALVPRPAEPRDRDVEQVAVVELDAGLGGP